MFKQLKVYYAFVSMPFVLLMIGSVAFFDAIKGTIDRNPHPQINYTIFIIILFGGIFILVNAHRLIREARTVVEFSGALRDKVDVTTLQDMSNRYTVDISCLLQMVAASTGRSISHQEQVAIEHELTNARERLNRRNALPQYLTGLLVGMGLLGTFIGLLSTLTDIGALIGSFADLDMKTVSPIVVFGAMIERMKAPMQSMSIAFSASMFGLLGSIILGLMMVGIRRLQGDIFSLLTSIVARHIEIGLSHGAVAVTTGDGSAPYSGDEYKVLIRIEQRLTEAARLQQKTLSAEIDDFQRQRAEMLRTLTEQTEASHSFRNELQQLGRQLGNIFSMLEKNNGTISTQISEMTVHLAGNAKESQKLLAQQVDGQKQLKDALDSYKIEERLIESARIQQRTLASELDDFQKQRGDMLRTLTEQTESSNLFRSELQQLGRELGTISQSMTNSNEKVRSQISELMVHMAADAKESHKLLAMQVNEQMRLRDSLDLRIKSDSSSGN